MFAKRRQYKKGRPFVHPSIVAAQYRDSDIPLQFGVFRPPMSIQPWKRRRASAICVGRRIRREADDRPRDPVLKRQIPASTQDVDGIYPSEPWKARDLVTPPPPSHRSVGGVRSLDQRRGPAPPRAVGTEDAAETVHSEGDDQPCGRATMPVLTSSKLHSAVKSHMEKVILETAAPAAVLRPDESSSGSVPPRFSIWDVIDRHDPFSGTDEDFELEATAFPSGLASRRLLDRSTVESSKRRRDAGEAPRGQACSPRKSRQSLNAAATVADVLRVCDVILVSQERDGRKQLLGEQMRRTPNTGSSLLKKTLFRSETPTGTERIAAAGYEAVLLPADRRWQRRNHPRSTSVRFAAGLPAQPAGGSSNNNADPGPPAYHPRTPGRRGPDPLFLYSGVALPARTSSAGVVVRYSHDLPTQVLTKPKADAVGFPLRPTFEDYAVTPTPPSSPRLDFGSTYWNNDVSCISCSGCELYPNKQMLRLRVPKNIIT